MPDRDALIINLDSIARCLDEDHQTMAGIVRDAIALLREQEPVPPDTAGAPWWRCGNCGGNIVTEQFRFCPWCGRKVKWE